MSKLAIGFCKIFLIGLVATIGMVSEPAAAVHALAPSFSTTNFTVALAPTDRLELAWAREQMIHDRLGFLFDHADQRIALVRQLVDKAKANGKDVAAVQAALDALSAALESARPGFESLQATFAAHPGFDGSGKVTDATLAAQTVGDLGVKLRETGATLSGPLQGLRSAIATFRQTNRPLAVPSPTPSR